MTWKREGIVVEVGRKEKRAQVMGKKVKGKWRRKYGFFTLKLDISKVYDRIEWRYLEVVLYKIGFCHRCVQ